MVIYDTRRGAVIASLNGGCQTGRIGYIDSVNWLTVQEKRVLILVLGLLALGELVKIYRASHPPTEVSQPATS